MGNWYSDRYRRHLVDMHIDDWNEEFLSCFDPDEYYALLKCANVNMAMIDLQSHVGLCYFPVKNGAVHRHFQEHPDDIKKLITLCRDGGIRVVGYYSINFNTWASDEYPEWDMIKENGRTRREDDRFRKGLCCPNNMGYRQFVYDQIREILEYVPEIDGLFFDMPFWPHTCYCPSCRARWEKEHGGAIPSEKLHSGADWEDFLRLRSAWMGEWTQSISDYARSVKPEIAVEFNYANAIASPLDIGCGDEVNEASDYSGGDLYGGFREQSFACKYYLSATRNEPFEYMTSRCDPDLNVNHTVTKSEKKLELSVMLTCAHHGAVLMIDAIDPRGTMDRRFYDRLGELYRREMRYEPYMTGRLISDVGILYHIPSKVRRHGSNFGHSEAAIQAGKTLAANHVPYSVVTYRNFDSLSDYPVIIVPMITSLSDIQRDKLIEYVSNGGRLYLSGGEDTILIKELLEAEVVGFTEHTVTYLAPQNEYEEMLGGFNEDYPLPFKVCAPLISGLAEDCTVLAKLGLPYTTQNEMRFASIHSNPPGTHTEYPILVGRQYGKGCVLWSGLPIEQDEVEAFRAVFMSCLRYLGSEQTVASDAPEQVELISFKDGGKVRVSCVKLEPSLPVLPSFKVTVQTENVPAAVKHLPDGELIQFKYSNGAVCFETRPMDIYDLYEISL